jgi:hypothetical protein
MIRTSSYKSGLLSFFREWASKNRISVTTLILIVGLVSFEMFNYSTTDFALRDLLGDLKFLGIFWSTILAIAFCGIDFAGISRLFIPDERFSDQKENIFLFGAWLLAATMNAVLTWWGVSMTIASHPVQSTSIVDASTIIQVVPIFVAIMVWLTRILLIGSFSMSNKKSNNRSKSLQKSSNRGQLNTRQNTVQQPVSVQMKSASSNQMKSQRPVSRFVSRPEPEYISENMISSSQSSYRNTNQNQTQGKRF